MPGGQPTEFTQEMADRICSLVESTPMGLRRLCDTHPDLPVPTTVKKWRKKFPQFEAQYAQAKRQQIEMMADDIIDIADDGSNDVTTNEDGDKIVNQDEIARSRLRVDSRKWLLSKLIPDQYGDQIKVEHSGHVGLTLDEMRQRLKEAKE